MSDHQSSSKMRLSPIGLGLRLVPSGIGLHKLSALLTLVLLIAAFSFTSPAFLTMNNGLTVLLQTSVIGLLAIGMTLVIITGGIDLSVGSVLALSGVVAGLTIKAGLPILPAMALGIAAGALCGFLNGLVITKMRITPFVATLGDDDDCPGCGLAAYRGSAYQPSG